MLDSMAGMAAAMGSGGHGQPSAPTDSDSDSDLDGGDDSVVTMVDVRHSDLPLKRNNVVPLTAFTAFGCRCGWVCLSRSARCGRA